MSSVEDRIAGDALPAKRISGFGLIGDIGATNARFALVQPGGQISPAHVYALNDYASLPEAIETYLREEKPTENPVQAVLAVASPVSGGAPVKDAPVGVIGPGTGLGVSAFVPSATGGAMIAGEGGHVTMAPATPQESALLDLMRTRFDHVSAERVLSGPGLVNLYNALCELAGTPAASYSAEQITNESIWHADPRTREVAALFCAMLGTVAGNLALTLGARGGIYISGGIVPRMSGFLAQSEFRARFEAKGRLNPYVAAVPTYVIICPLPVLLGAAALLLHEC